jgi:hypothetical protein
LGSLFLFCFCFGLLCANFYLHHRYLH